MAVVPEHLRPRIGPLLTALVRGERPELLTWVHDYGEHGATLVEQPEDIWSHEWTEVGQRDDGGWWFALPLWTTDESPSDLSAEGSVSSDGQAILEDIHVI